MISPGPVTGPKFDQYCKACITAREPAPAWGFIYPRFSWSRSPHQLIGGAKTARWYRPGHSLPSISTSATSPCLASATGFRMSWFVEWSMSLPAINSTAAAVDLWDSATSQTQKGR